jgi:hypothetical protein
MELLIKKLEFRPLDERMQKKLAEQGIGDLGGEELRTL